MSRFVVTFVCGMWQWFGHLYFAIRGHCNTRQVNCTTNSQLSAHHGSGGGVCNLTLDLRPVVRTEEGWYGSAVAILRGSLLFSAKLRHDFIEYKVGNVSACSNQPYNQQQRCNKDYN